MFKKKNFRRRVGDDGEPGEGQQDQDGVGSGRPVAVSRGPSQPKPPGSKPVSSGGSRVSLLSFADEAGEDGEGGSIGKFGSGKKSLGKKGPEGHTLLKKKEGGKGEAGKDKEKAKKGVVMVGAGAADERRSVFGGGFNPGVASNVVPQAGEYTKERLAELAVRFPRSCACNIGL